jgi:thymidylate synthase ThyX
MNEAIGLFKGIHETMPYQAQYVVPYGFYASWYYRMNARQLFHLCELRTTPAGHPDYRRIVQNVYKKVAEVHPSVTSHMKYVNMESKTLGRLDSEIRIALKKGKAKTA